MRKPNPTNITDINAALAKNRPGGSMQRIQLDAIMIDCEQIRQSLLIGTYDVTAEKIDTSLYSDEKSAQLEQIIQLAYTIEKHGMLEPVIVYLNAGNHYSLISGERRYLAALYATKHLKFAALIDAKVFSKKPTQDTIEDIQFIENHHRNPLKLADVVTWMLRRFDRFEAAENRQIEALDIQKIMAVKKTQAYQYRTIYKGNREKVVALLQANNPPKSLQAFTDQMEESEDRPDEPATTTDQRQETTEKPAPKTIKITLPPDIRERFIDACQKQNINPYDVLRNYITHYADQGKLF